jgi:hypothetical protein
VGDRQVQTLDVGAEIRKVSTGRIAIRHWSMVCKPRYIYISDLFGKQKVASLFFSARQLFNFNIDEDIVVVLFFQSLDFDLT